MTRGGQREGEEEGEQAGSREEGLFAVTRSRQAARPGGAAGGIVGGTPSGDVMGQPRNGSRTSILGVAVRDLGRLRFVTATVARHGFGEILIRSPIAKRFTAEGALPEGDEALSTQPPAVRFRRLLEALGPTWIKLGQILSSRVDLLPPDYIEALKELQDSAPVLPFEVIAEAVTTGLGRSLQEAFADFDERPLATASIAQTHLATTHEGDRVVVKVQRPDIGPQMRGDLDLLYLGARILEATIDELNIYRPSEIVQAFEKDLIRELNFTTELSYLTTAAQLLDPNRQVQVPAPYPALSSRTVLTMAYCPGVPLHKLEKGSDRARHAVEELLHAMARQVFKDGFFHGDPHPGNLLLTDEGELCLIDYGLVGRLTLEQREDVVRLVVAALSGDVHGIARVLLKMGVPTERIHMAEFKADIGRIRSSYLVVGGIEEVDSGAFVNEFVMAAQRYRIKLNPAYSVLVKAAVTVEGVVRSLHPDVDLVAIARPYVDELVRERLSPKRLLDEAVGGVSGVGGLLRDLPGHLDQVLHDVETGNLQVRMVTPELDRLPAMIHKSASRLSLSLFAASMSVAAALLIPNDPTSLGGIPVLSTVVLVLAVLSWFVLWWWHFLGTGRKFRLSPWLALLARVLPDEE